MTIAKAITTREWSNILEAAIQLNKWYGEELEYLLSPTTKVFFTTREMVTSGFKTEIEEDYLITFIYDYKGEELHTTYNMSIRQLTTLLNSEWEKGTK